MASVAFPHSIHAGKCKGEAKPEMSPVCRNPSFQSPDSGLFGASKGAIANNWTSAGAENWTSVPSISVCIVEAATRQRRMLPAKRPFGVPLSSFCSTSRA
jgi:hypothetical protein